MERNFGRESFDTELRNYVLIAHVKFTRCSMFASPAKTCSQPVDPALSRSTLEIHDTPVKSDGL